jgi:hypothetical protein
MKLDNSADWQRSKADVFWAEIAPCDHVVQIYESDGVFLDSLTGFVMGGFDAEECVIVIATEGHLKSLENRLRILGIGTDDLAKDDRYIPLNAEATLAKFMVKGWPDEALFMKTVSELVDRANCKNRRVRAFGEMVAVLWAQGNYGATVNLEHLWNKFCEQQSFSLFCAYPKSGFTKDIKDSINHICGCHSKIIEGSQRSISDIHYKSVN